MKTITVTIQVNETNRYASETNKGIEDVHSITVLENGVETVFENPKENERTERGYSKQQTIDMVLGNIRYLQANPDLK